MGLTLPQRLYVAYKAMTGRLPFPGGSGGQGWGWSDFLTQFGSGTKIDFATEVGPIQNLSLVQSGIGWLARGLNSARVQVVKVDADSKETDIRDHPVAKLFHRPNPFYSGAALMSGIALSYLTFATAYALIVKNRMGQPAELWWEPHWTIRPRWESNGTQVIDHYEIWRNGRWITVGEGQELPYIEAIVWRDGYNPETRCGWNRMTSLLQEFYTDKRGTLFMAQLLRSGLVPPVVVGLGNKENPFIDDAQHTNLNRFKADLIRKMSGDAAGEPMVTAGPTDVQKMGFEYDKVGMREVRLIPEERFCSVMGVSPHSLHLGAATSGDTFSNVVEHLKNDYVSVIVPLQDQIADEVDRVLLPMVDEQENVQCAWDYTKTPLMQKDQTEIANRTSSLYVRGGIDRAEFREANGYKMRPEDIGVYYMQPTNPNPQSKEDQNQPRFSKDYNLAAMRAIRSAMVS